MTPNSVGDAPVLPSLLGKIDPHEGLPSVSGNGDYDTKACHDAIALSQAMALSLCERMPVNPGKRIALEPAPATSS